MTQDMDLPRKKPKGRLSLKAKEELRREKEEIERRIIQRNNAVVLETYHDVRRLCQINHTLTGRRDLEDIARATNCNVQWLRYLLALRKLKDQAWLDKIDIKIVLFILNFNAETVERQDRYFERAQFLGNSLQKMKLEVYKEFIGEAVAKETPDTLVQRFNRLRTILQSNLPLLKLVEDDSAKAEIRASLRTMKVMLEEVFDE